MCVQDVYAWKAWNGFFALIVTILVLGVLVDLVLAVILTRANPCRHTFAQLCCACCIPAGRRSTLKGALREHVGWNAAFAVIVVLQLALTVAMFAFGFMLLIAWTLLSEGCACAPPAWVSVHRPSALERHVSCNTCSYQV